MSAFAPFTEVQFRTMAMSKARGCSWPMMATSLALPLDVVERVAWTHEKQWNLMLAKAERMVARETIAEVVSSLRRDVRDADPPLRPTMANSLTRLLKLQQELAPPRRPRPMSTPSPASQPRWQRQFLSRRQTSRPAKKSPSRNRLTCRNSNR